MSIHWIQGKNNYINLGLKFLYLAIITNKLNFFFLSHLVFFKSALVDGLSLESERQVSSVSRKLLSILADLSHAVDCIVSTLPLIFKSSCPFTNPLVTVSRDIITVGITVTFMLNSRFNFVGRSGYLSFFLLSFNFTLWLDGTANFLIQRVLSFLLIIIRSSCLAEFRWSVCISKSQRSLSV